MIEVVISKYLESHKRLVIPQLGAFLVKKPEGHVYFSELMRRDDGVLRQLLSEAGLSELEIGGEIDRLVFEVRHCVELGGEYPLKGLGVFRGEENGAVAFEYKPEPIPAAEPVAKSNPSADACSEGSSADLPVGNQHPGAEAETPAGKSAAADTCTAEAHAGDVGHKTARSAAPNPLPAEEKAAAKEESVSGEDPSGERLSAEEQHPEEETLSGGHIRPDRVAEAVKAAFSMDDVHVSESAKMNPEPCLKGLRYRKPHKSTDVCSYVEPKSGRGMDRFLVVGLIAILIALAALAFGYFVNETRAELMDEPLELVQPSGDQSSK